MVDPLDLTIVIPAYNEEQRLAPTLTALSEKLAARPEQSEIVVVDDGSRDATAEVARGLGAPGLRVISYQPNRGKGRAVRTGVLAARGAVVCFMDADLSTDLGALDRALGEIAAGWDVVIGSRAIAGSTIVVHQPRYREIASQIFNLVQVTMSGVRGYADTQCGFKVFRADAAKAIFSRAQVDGFMFDVELLFLAERLGYHIREIPVEWTNDPASRLRIVRDTARMFRDLARIRWAGRTLPRRPKPTRRPSTESRPSEPGA
ncbi:MAG: dolichyl-phosphate beta-glucosyltransferase [Dehalococcoidia bacterium]